MTKSAPPWLSARGSTNFPPAPESTRAKSSARPGDGLFLLFDSAVDAVTFAVKMQERLREMNEGAREEERIVFRIGINLGDVLGEEGELSARKHQHCCEKLRRFPSLAEFVSPGRSTTVLATRCRLATNISAPQQFKNIKEGVDVFQIHDNPTSAAMTAGLRRERKDTTSTSDKPLIDQSIVVLPFAYQGGDQSDSWFADGLTEDITTSLSKFHQFFVISRNSAYVYNDRQLTPRETARELGVRYVVHGSVRKAGKPNSNYYPVDRCHSRPNHLG